MRPDLVLCTACGQPGHSRSAHCDPHLALGVAQRALDAGQLVLARRWIEVVRMLLARAARAA